MNKLKYKSETKAHSFRLKMRNELSAIQSPLSYDCNDIYKSKYETTDNRKIRAILDSWRTKNSIQDYTVINRIQSTFFLIET